MIVDNKTLTRNRSLEESYKTTNSFTSACFWLMLVLIMTVTPSFCCAAASDKHYLPFLCCSIYMLVFIIILPFNLKAWDTMFPEMDNIILEANQEYSSFTPCLDKYSKVNTELLSEKFRPVEESMLWGRHYTLCLLVLFYVPGITLFCGLCYFGIT